MADAYAWHVRAYLRDLSGRRIYADDRDFLFCVQRYRRPEEGGTNGVERTDHYATEADAQAEADRMNAGGKGRTAYRNI